MFCFNLVSEKEKKFIFWNIGRSYYCYFGLLYFVPHFNSKTHLVDRTTFKPNHINDIIHDPYILYIYITIHKQTNKSSNVLINWYFHSFLLLIQFRSDPIRPNFFDRLTGHHIWYRSLLNFLISLKTQTLIIAYIYVY